MAWEVEYTDEFAAWWRELTEPEQDAIDVVVRQLIDRGPRLGFPHSSSIHSSRHSNMRELRIQHAGQPYRVLYAFDSRRTAMLLIGGNKAGNDRWYDEYVAKADAIYDVHLEWLRKEG